MTYLGDVARGRDNNFNLIRAVAATAVLVSHAYPISQGPGAAEPLRASLGHSLGSLAVFVFFAISGFLISASFERSRSRTDFVTARVLRLFPGLIVSLLVVAFVIGPVVTDLPVAAYLGDPGTYTFLVRNLLLIEPQYTLPGVFAGLPYPAVEGSIWTLFYEVACYAGVFLAGLLGAFRRPGLMALLLAACGATWFAFVLFDLHVMHHVDTLVHLMLPFAIGVAFHAWQHRIPLHAGLAILLGLAAWASRGSPAYTFVLMVALAYGTFWLAYVPQGAIRAYNRIGDYSYGIYIYAFPCQGLAVWLFGPMPPLQNMAWGFLLTIVPSVLSWHLVEKPALDRRKDLGRRFRSRGTARE